MDIDVIKNIASLIGALTVIMGAVFGIYRFLEPIYKRAKDRNRIISVENILHVAEIAYRAHSKSKLAIKRMKMPVYVCSGLNFMQSFIGIAVFLTSFQVIYWLIEKLDNLLKI